MQARAWMHRLCILINPFLDRDQKCSRELLSMKYHMEEIVASEKRHREMELLAWKLLQNKGRALDLFLLSVATAITASRTPSATEQTPLPSASLA